MVFFYILKSNIQVLPLLGHDMLDTRYVFTQVSGYTFPMALAAMTGSTWQAGLDFSGKDRGPIVGMKEVVEFYKAWNGEGDFGKWSVDQVGEPGGPGGWVVGQVDQVALLGELSP